ncbi:SDR family oxidoreductase [Actinomyces vulturis]|uniref:SDR family oxidoreductase n=1 Tax=Actinomyces vulturis TaxID=1857645 RepID=UPI00082D30A2|nr:SDR family oxidoreductase [Actinomyces vulturis]
MSSLSSSTAKRVLVTGASTGIGWATVELLASHGWEVIATARRAERLEELAKKTGCTTITADLQNLDDVQRLITEANANGPIDALVNNAGGALGADSVEEGKLDEWQTMYERNVLAPLRLSQGFISMMKERGGDILFVTSTAASDPYPGGAGYVAAKHGERVLAQTLRREVVGSKLRVTEIAPGMVHTEEFSLNRFHGDADRAAQVYAGVDKPLTAQDIAQCIVWALELPAHVNIESMIVRPRAQFSNTVVVRNND